MEHKNLYKKKESKKLLEWRSKQKRGAIMKPSTFSKIASKYGGEKGKRIAGSAYWRAAEHKFGARK